MSSITLKDYLTASGKYPERENHVELTAEKIENAYKLLTAVNAFLADLGVNNVTVSSGFRPSAANSAAGGAKLSYHCKALAIDLLDDKKQTLAKKITSEMLRKHGLFMEDEKYTVGKNTNWVHLQLSSEMRDRPSRKFIP